MINRIVCGRLAVIALTAIAGAGSFIGTTTDAAAQRIEERRGPDRDNRRDQPRRSAGWVNLGCQAANFQRDRDVVRVGKRQGNFRAVRLRVSGNDIFVRQLLVVYGNGQPDNLPVQRMIRAGTVSAPIDLIGRQRFINRVEMVYRSRPNFRGSASVCVEALD